MRFVLGGELPCPLPAPAELLLCLENRFAQSVDFLEGVVEIEAGSSSGGQAQPGMERLGAVMPGTDGDASAVEHV